MDKEREKQLQICEKIGEQVHLGFLKVKDGEKLGICMFSNRA